MLQKNIDSLYIDADRAVLGQCVAAEHGLYRLLQTTCLIAAV